MPRPGTAARSLPAQDLAPLVKIRAQLGARPCVVAEGYDIRPGVQYGVRLARSYADNVCVFAVYDDKIKLQAPCADGANF